MRLLTIIFTSLIVCLSAEAQEVWYSQSAAEFWKNQDVNQIIDPSNFNQSLLEAALFHAGNEARESKGKKALNWSPILSKSARHQSGLMAKSRKLSHTWRRPSNSRKLIDRIKLFNGNFKVSGENIAQFYLLDIPEDEEYYFQENAFYNSKKQKLTNKTYAKLAKECMQAWMNSRGHRENLLYPFQEIGTGVSFWVKSKKGLNFDIYLSQNFGTP
jgi:uncharacterized protein YkwD